MSDKASLSEVGLQIFEKEVNIDAANLLNEVSSTDDNLSDLSDDPELVYADYGNGRGRSLTKSRKINKSEEELNDLNLVSNYLNVDKYKTRNIVECSASDDSLDDFKKESKQSDDDELKGGTRDSKDKEKHETGKRVLKSQIKNVVALQHWKQKCFYLFEEGVVEVCKLDVADHRYIESLKPKYLKWERIQLILGRDEIRGAKVRSCYERSP
jgi:hypothetical protein